MMPQLCEQNNCYHFSFLTLPNFLSIIMIIWSSKCSFFKRTASIFSVFYVKKTSILKNLKILNFEFSKFILIDLQCHLIDL